MQTSRLRSLTALFLLALPWGCAHRGTPSPSARRDGPIISQAEFDLCLQALPEPRREAMRQDPEERSRVFDEFLRRRLYAMAAQASGHPALDSLRHRLSLLDKMVITQFYQLVFIGENLGRTRGEIEAYHSRDPEKFRDSAGRLPPVHEILARVADSMALTGAVLDSLHRANPGNHSLPEPDLRRRLAEKYLLETKQRRSENAAAELKAKYGARLFFRSTDPTGPTEAEIADYYARNPEAYQSPEAFDLYHIESSAPQALRGKVAATKGLEEFKALALRASENAWTKPLGGRLGPVKRDFCLPYGIGLMPSLFPVLDTARPGKIAGPLQNPETGKWHYFWLAGKIPRTLKPLDRVKFLVKQDVLANRTSRVGPDDTLAVIPGRRAILAKDADFLRDEFPEPLRDHYTRENLADFLLEREVIVAEAEALGLLEDDRLKAMRLEHELSFWSRFYEDSLLNPSWHGDTAAMAALFVRKQRVFTRDSEAKDWHPFARDLAAYPLLTPEEIAMEHHINRERYLRGDSLPALAVSEYEVFQTLKGEAYRRLDARVASALKARFGVRIAPSLQEPAYEPAEKILRQARDFHRDRKPGRALFLYGKLREKFPGRAALQHSVGLGMARIHLEQRRYQQALAEYRRASYLYPENPDDYKALFMEGFILAEHFKSDSAAVRAFERMLEKHPGSALSKEADWMIRNIRSGGTLMPGPEGKGG